MIARIRDRELLIEVTVTHGVDDAKLKTIKDLGLSCVEINLSDVQRDLSRENLEKIVVDDSSRKRWLHNEHAIKKRNKMLAEATLLQTVQRGFADHADGCPLPARVWRGKPYANMTDDCTGCEHMITLSFDVGVIYDGFRALRRPPPAGVPRPPPEAFEHPEEEDPINAVGSWLYEQNPNARGT